MPHPERYPTSSLWSRSLVRQCTNGSHFEGLPIFYRRRRLSSFFSPMKFLPASKLHISCRGSMDTTSWLYLQSFFIAPVGSHRKRPLTKPNLPTWPLGSSTLINLVQRHVAWWAPEDSNLSTPLPYFAVGRFTAAWGERSPVLARGFEPRLAPL